MRSDIRHALCSHHERTLDVLLSRICFNLNMSLQIWLSVAARFAKWVFATNRIKYRSQSWIHLVRLVVTSQHCSTENAYQTTELNWLYCMCRLSGKHTSSRKCTCDQMSFEKNSFYFLLIWQHTFAKTFANLSRPQFELSRNTWANKSFRGPFAGKVVGHI